MAFVQKSGLNFILNGQIWVPIGAAVYGYYGSNTAYANRVTAAVAAGFNIIRYINFLQTLPYPTTYDSTPGTEYTESIWSKLDYGLDQARQAGIKVLLDISDIGGIGGARSYVFADANYTTLYTDFVAWLAERTNTVNGLKYKNDDTIAIFAIAGEIGDKAVGVSYTFFHTVAGAMKTAGFQQIIHAGGMKPEQIVDASYGHQNYNPIDILSSSNIDCASTHPYYTFADMTSLFPEIQSYSVAKNKPWFMEEFGYASSDRDKRRDLRRTYKLGFQYGSAGGLIWNFDEFGDDGFGYSGYGVSALGKTPESYRLMRTIARAKSYSPRDIVF